jgi:hypothetical protein
MIIISYFISKNHARAHGRHMKGFLGILKIVASQYSLKQMVLVPQSRHDTTRHDTTRHA